jgi:hypothetical protein
MEQVSVAPELLQNQEFRLMTVVCSHDYKTNSAFSLLLEFETSHNLLLVKYYTEQTGPRTKCT